MTAIQVIPVASMMLPVMSRPRLTTTALSVRSSRPDSTHRQAFMVCVRRRVPGPASGAVRLSVMSASVSGALPVPAVKESKMLGSPVQLFDLRTE